MESLPLRITSPQRKWIKSLAAVAAEASAGIEWDPIAEGGGAAVTTIALSQNRVQDRLAALEQLRDVCVEGGPQGQSLVASSGVLTWMLGFLETAAGLPPSSTAPFLPAVLDILSALVSVDEGLPRPAPHDELIVARLQRRAVLEGGGVNSVATILRRIAAALTWTAGSVRESRSLLELAAAAVGAIGSMADRSPEVCDRLRGPHIRGGARAAGEKGDDIDAHVVGGVLASLVACLRVAAHACLAATADAPSPAHPSAPGAAAPPSDVALCLEVVASSARGLASLIYPRGEPVAAGGGPDAPIPGVQAELLRLGAVEAAVDAAAAVAAAAAFLGPRGGALPPTPVPLPLLAAGRVGALLASLCYASAGNQDRAVDAGASERLPPLLLLAAAGDGCGPFLRPDAGLHVPPLLAAVRQLALGCEEHQVGRRAYRGGGRGRPQPLSHVWFSVWAQNATGTGCVPASLRGWLLHFGVSLLPT